MPRVAAEREMNTSIPILWSNDVARTVEVYQARTAHPSPYPLLALTTHTVAFLSCCGASHDDIKRQGFDILASTEFIDAFY